MEWSHYLREVTRASSDVDVPKFWRFFKNLHFFQLANNRVLIEFFAKSFAPAPRGSGVRKIQMTGGDKMLLSLCCVFIVIFMVCNLLIVYQ